MRVLLGENAMRVIAVAFVCTVSWIALALAQEQRPGAMLQAAEVGQAPAWLQAAVAGQLPAWWSIGEIRVTASVNQGDAVEPKLKQRFEALIMPQADLFAEDKSSVGSFGPFLPIIATTKAGTARTLYGIANSTYSAGNWATELLFENSVGGLGKPVDLFPSPTLVRGSEDEKTIVDRLRADAARTAKEALAADLDRLKAEHAAATRAIRAAQEKELDELKTAHALELGRLEARHKDAVARQQAALADVEGAVQQTKGEAEAIIEAVRKARDSELAALKETFAAEEARARAALEAKRSTFRAQHGQELALLEAEHRAAVEKLETEIRNKGELIALEQERQRRIEELLQLEQQASVIDRRVAEQRIQNKGEENRSLSMLERYMAGNDKSAAVAAFDVAANSVDDSLKSSAIQLGITSRFDQIRKESLRSSFMSLRFLEMSYKAQPEQEGSDFQGSISLVFLEKKELKGAVNFTAKWQGKIFGEEEFDNDLALGALEELNLNAASTNCSLSAGLNESGYLEGTLQCVKVRTPAGCCHRATFSIIARQH
jgi:hypothetical protein